MPSRRLVRTEMVALWSRKQASEGNHIMSKTELSVPNANCQYTRQPVRSVAQMHLNVKGLEPNWCQICLKVRAALHQVEDKPACLTRLFLRICL